GTRLIRDSDIDQQHFEILLNGGKKLNSSLMNTLAAKIQLEAESAGQSPDFCVFLSWLGPIVEGAMQEGPVVGTFKLHV
ncbi:hypothetical protein BT96DRAFT_787292, partial [Gymnopus androsaceus JB14]